MKDRAIQLIDNLHSFLLNIKSIHEHPYSVGVDMDKLVVDLLEYVNDMRSVVSEIEEPVSADEAPENDQ